jgi:hypothetical protein
MVWFIDKIRELRKKEDKAFQEVVATPAKESKPKKPRKPRKPKVAKKQEPKVDIIKFDFDPQNPRLGSIELDWNDEFVELLVKHGYPGTVAEEVVDAWLNDVCRTIIANQFPGGSVNSGSQMVQRKDLGDGKTEVS